MFENSCLHFPTTTFPHCTHPHIPPSILPPFGFVRGCFIPVLWPPFPFFYPHHFPPPSPLVTVSLFLISMSLILFWLLVCFIDQIPLTGEIIWCLSFTTWLISLSIMLPRLFMLSRRVGAPYFFLLRSIPLCKCTTVFFDPLINSFYSDLHWPRDKSLSQYTQILLSQIPKNLFCCYLVTFCSV